MDAHFNTLGSEPKKRCGFFGDNPHIIFEHELKMCIHFKIFTVYSDSTSTFLPLILNRTLSGSFKKSIIGFGITHILESPFLLFNVFTETPNSVASFFHRVISYETNRIDIKFFLTLQIHNLYITVRLDIRYGRVAEHGKGDRPKLCG